jgi:hypothetical protein
VDWFHVVGVQPLDEIRKTERGEVITALATTPLTAADRCDRCGAQAYIRVRLASGGELLFCAHHGKRYEERLRSVAIDIYDETDKLGETPHTPPNGER